MKRVREVRVMKIQNLSPGGYAANTYLVTKGSSALLVDCAAPADAVLAALAKEGTTLAAIFLTHGHFDHMLTLAEVKEKTGAPILLSDGDRDLPADAMKNAHGVFFGESVSYPEPDTLLSDGDCLSFGDLTVTVRATPGHTKGSSLFLIADAIFTGDTVFAAGYGRYDLYGGDPKSLFASLARLTELPREHMIYPGHGAPARLAVALKNLDLF